MRLISAAMISLLAVGAAMAPAPSKAGALKQAQQPKLPLTGQNKAAEEMARQKALADACGEGLSGEQRADGVIVCRQKPTETAPQTSAPAAGVAATSWIIPNISTFRRDDYAVRTCANLLNASDSDARPHILLFGGAGVFDILESQAMTDAIGVIGRGAQRENCFVTPSETPHWVLVLSDAPLIVTARREEGGRNTSGVSDLPTFQLDCEDSEGAEFACSFVAAQD